MVEVDGLTKVYGSRVAIWRVSFRVARGEIIGFLGPNGAGKTTTMRIVTGFVPPSSGRATIAGLDVATHPLEVKSKIGYLCESPPVYREMVVASYLAFVADIKKTPRSKRRALVDRAIQLCGLEDVAHRVIGHLSKGYRQRVGLAQAILHEPEVLILDEPTSGLDPQQNAEIRGRIKYLAEQGRQTVILSTHILPEVTATCSRVVIINEGQIVAEDTTERLMTGGSRERIRLRIGRDEPALERRLAAVDGVEHVGREQGELLVDLTGGDAARERLAAEVVASGAGLLEMYRERASLEEVFLRLVTDEGGEAVA